MAFFSFSTVHSFCTKMFFFAWCDACEKCNMCFMLNKSAVFLWLECVVCINLLHIHSQPLSLLPVRERWSMDVRQKLISNNSLTTVVIRRLCKPFYQPTEWANEWKEFSRTNMKKFFTETHSCMKMFNDR